MTYNLKKLFAGLLAVAVCSGFAACSDDDEPISEWGATYVYMQRPGLGVSDNAIKLVHSSAGVTTTDPLTYPIVIRLSKALASDVTVDLGVKTSDPLPAGNFTFANGGKVTIPAGELEGSDELRISSDWSFITSDAAATYQATVSISSIAPSSDKVRISTKQVNETFTMKKSLKSDLFTDQEPSGTQMDRSGWTILASNAEGKEPTDDYTSRLADGSAWSYLYTFGYALIQIDLGSVQKLTGICSYCGYGASYAHSSCTIEVGMTGSDWKPLCDKAEITPDYYQWITFAIPQEARYIRWHQWGSNVCTSEIYVKVE